MPASDSHSIDKNPVIFKEETLMELNVEEIMEILPHRYPMLLVDKITELVPMDYAIGVKSVTMNEPFSRDISRDIPSCRALSSVKPWRRSAA